MLHNAIPVAVYPSIVTCLDSSRQDSRAIYQTDLYLVAFPLQGILQMVTQARKLV